MSQEPKRQVCELPHGELTDIVRQIQELLWLDRHPTDETRSHGGKPEYFWNDDKEWSCVDVLPDIVTVLEDHGLKPVDPELEGT